MNSFYSSFGNELLKLAQGMPLTQAQERAPKSAPLPASRVKQYPPMTVKAKTPTSPLSTIKERPMTSATTEVQTRPYAQRQIQTEKMQRAAESAAGKKQQKKLEPIPKKVISGARAETQRYLGSRLGVPGAVSTPKPVSRAATKKFMETEFKPPKSTGVPAPGGEVSELEGATPPIPTRGTVGARQRLLSRRFSELPKEMTTGPGKIKPEKYAPELPTGLSEKARKTLTSWYAGKGSMKALGKHPELKSMVQREKEEQGTQKFIAPYLKKGIGKGKGKGKAEEAAKGKSKLERAHNKLKKFLPDYPTPTFEEAYISPWPKLYTAFRKGQVGGVGPETQKQLATATRRAREAAKQKELAERKSKGSLADWPVLKEKMRKSREELRESAREPEEKLRKEIQKRRHFINPVFHPSPFRLP